jgi:hypothetical protein
MMLLLLQSPACKTYVHFKYGLTEPGEESPEKLMDFLEKHHFPTENQYLFSDSASYTRAIKNSLFMKYFLNNLIFDRNGTLLQRDTAQCQWSGYEKIKSLNPDSIYEKSNDLKLNQILSLVKECGNNAVLNEASIEPDFTIIVTWAKFLGDYNSRLFVLSDAVNLNKTARIRLIWLNIDMQESWNLTKDQKMEFR